MNQEIVGSIISKANKKPVPMPISSTQILQKIKYNDALEPHQKTALYLTYLTGARATEAISIKASDFQTQDNQIIVLVKTQKKRRGEPYRYLPLRSSNHAEQEMLVNITRHTNTLIAAEQDNTALIPYCRSTLWNWARRVDITTKAINQRARKIIDDYPFKMYPHYLRHCRASHLVNNYGFDAFALQQYMGWSDIEMAKIYVSLDWKRGSKLLMELSQPPYSSTQQ